METGVIKWERENIEVTHSYPTKVQRTIWLKAVGAKTKGVMNTMFISADLVSEAGWRAGDTIWLYKSGNLFMIRREPSDFALRSNGNAKCNKQTLMLRSTSFVAHLGWAVTGATEYDAWVDNGDILFKARKGNNDGKEAE